MVLKSPVFQAVWAICAGMTAFGVPCDGSEKVSTGDVRTDSVLVEVQKRLSAVRTCRAQVVTVLRMMGQQIQVRDTAAYKVPARIRLEKVLPGGIREITVSTGSIMWTYDSEEQMAIRINLARVYRSTGREADVYQPDPTRPFRGLEWKTIRAVGTEPLGADTLHVFEAVPQVNLMQAELQIRLTKVRFSIHPTDGLLRFVRFYDGSGDEILSQRFEEVELNPELDNSLFEFIIPANAGVLDKTDDVIKLLKAAGGDLKTRAEK